MSCLPEINYSRGFSLQVVHCTRDLKPAMLCRFAATLTQNMTTFRRCVALLNFGRCKIKTAQLLLQWSWLDLRVSTTCSGMSCCWQMLCTCSRESLAWLSCLSESDRRLCTALFAASCAVDVSLYTNSSSAILQFMSICICVYMHLCSLQHIMSSQCRLNIYCLWLIVQGSDFEHMRLPGLLMLHLVDLLSVPSTQFPDFHLQVVHAPSRMFTSIFCTLQSTNTCRHS